MNIIIKEVGAPAQIRSIDQLTLKKMQALVGGLIEPIYMDDIICWCNEESKLIGLDVNIALSNCYMGDIIDTVHGSIFFTSVEENAPGLSCDQVQSLLEKLNYGPRTFAVSDYHEVPILTI